MDIGLVTIAVFAVLVAVVIAAVVVGSIRQRRRRAARPARHEGERQPQRGRVFKHGTNHSNTPDGW
jgi:flagellar biosynthesis/type III secretory pathway M-ring protein FliF/YscJ